MTIDTTVLIGNAPAHKIEVLSSDSITVTSPVLELGTVDVVIANPRGERAVLTDAYTTVAVTLTPLTIDVSAGDPVSVTWSASRARLGDFVAFVGVGSSATPHDEWGYAWEYTKGTPTGTWHFMPHPSLYPPGQYEFRYGGGGVYTGWATESVPVTIR